MRIYFSLKHCFLKFIVENMKTKKTNKACMFFNTKIFVKLKKF